MVSAYFFARSSVDQSRLAHQSRERRLPRVVALPATVVAGMDQVIAAHNVHFELVKGSFDYLLNDNNELLVSGILRDEFGRVIAELRDSQLWIAIGSGYDVNSDDRSLEVVGPEGEPILTVRCSEDRRTMYVEYVTYLLAENGKLSLLHVNDSGIAMNPKDQRDRLRKEPIFQYPGWLYPGERVAQHSSKYAD